MTQPQCTILRVAEGGRIVIPADIRDQLGIQVGTDVVVTVEGDHATIMTAKAARRRAQARVRRYIPASACLSDELLADRKQEARRE